MICIKNHIKTEFGIRYSLYSGKTYSFEFHYYGYGNNIETEASSIFLTHNGKRVALYNERVFNERFITLKEYRRHKLNQLNNFNEEE